MHAYALRSILLVKAVEDEDAAGAVLTRAERDAATREAVRDVPETGASSRDDRAWRVLALRAGRLHGRLVERHPVVARAVALETHLARATAALLAVALVAGVALSLVDSRVRIEILAFPLLGLVLWNLAVYALLAVAWLRRTRRSPAAATQPSGWASWGLGWGWRRAGRLIRQAAFHHRPLAAALRRFSEAWWPHASRLLAWEGRRAFHAGAAMIAVGLVAGFYVRGIALEYRAGWESTFLDPGQVQGLLHVIYGPAAAVSGVPLPADAASVAALHWRDGAGGGAAAPWIHLMAVTALLFVVVPRTLLAAAAWLGLLHARRNVATPDSLLSYARGVLGESDAAPPPLVVRVTPYAYQPDGSSRDGLHALLQAAFGAGSSYDFAPQVAYGAEASLAERPAPERLDGDALLFTLAATPEAENHGAALATLRERTARSGHGTRAFAIVDESAFLARMEGDATLASRVEQRRAAWQQFLADHRVGACLVDLAAIGRSQVVGEPAVVALRGAIEGPAG